MTSPLASDRPSQLPYLMVAHLLLLLGYTYNKGLFFHPAQLGLLAFGWLILLLPLLKKSWLTFEFKASPLNLLLAANLVSFILFYFFDGGIYLVSSQAFTNITLLKFVVLLLFFLYFVNFNLSGRNFFSVVALHFKKRKFVYLVLLALILRLATIFYSPTPKIDVFWVLDGGANALLHFSNPYSTEFFSGYSAPECQQLYGSLECDRGDAAYLPLVFLSALIFKVILGDVRFVYILAIFGMAAMIYFLLNKKFRHLPQIPELVALLILYLPLGLFVLEQTWIDQLSLFFLYLFVFLILTRRSYWSYLVFGLFLATKQTMLIFLPFLLMLKPVNFKKIILTAVVFLVTILPFALWNFSDFFDDVVIDHLQYQEALHALTFNTLIKIYFHQTIIYSLIVIILLISLFLFLISKVKRRDLAGMIHSALIFLLAVFLLKRGFAHYYYAVSAIIILLISLDLYGNDQDLPAGNWSKELTN